MSDVDVTGYWSTQQVCKYFGGITARTLCRWKAREHDPFPHPKHAGLGAKSLYNAQAVVSWDLRNQRG